MSIHKSRLTLFPIRIFSVTGLVILTAFGVSAGTTTWNGPATASTANIWSAAGNWTTVGGSTPPGVTDDVKFFDVGAIAGVSNINNTVDVSLTIGSLQYGNTNNNHTTLINSGVILSVTNTSGLFVGTPGAGSPTTQQVNATVTGQGVLVVTNRTANLVVNQGDVSGTGTQRAMLDLSGLDNFSGSVRNIFVGSTGAGTVPTANGAAVTGTLLLAKTNVITAVFSPANVHSTSLGIDVGYNGAGTQGGADFLFLGQANTINVDTLAIGRCKAVGVMSFASFFTNNNPTAIFRGTNGGSTRVSYWTVGDMGPRGSGSGVALGTNDFTFGSVDALVDTMILGQDPVSTDTTVLNGAACNGVLKFNAGVIDVNTLVLGSQQSTAARASAQPLIGKILINGNATLKVNTVLKMGFTVATTTGALGTFGQLNVTNGTVLVNSITVASNTVSPNNLISLSNSTFIVSNALATSSFPLTNFFTANSLLGLTITSDSATKAFLGILTTGGTTNVIQLGSTPVFFGSYPVQFPLIDYASLNAFNFGLTNIPSWALGASLSNNVANKSIDLVLPSDPRPVISVQPLSYSGSPGDNVTFSVTAGGVAPLSYRWRTNGVNISDGSTGNGSTNFGSTTSVLGVTNVQPADSVSAPGYTVVITNLYGSVTSSPAVLTISAGAVPPNITGPTNLTVIAGNNVTINDSVTGSPLPVLQWFDQAGSPIPSATTSALTLTNVQYSQNGFTYSLVASNAAGMATNSTTLYVLVPPGISQQPTNLTVVAGSPAIFSATASGVPAVKYQWNKNGSPIANATNAAYTLASALGADNGAIFTVTVTNSAGTLTSSNAQLMVLSTMTGTFLPANGAVNISPDQQLRIIFSSAPFLNTTGVLTVRDAANNSVVATIDSSQFLSYTPGNTSIQTIPNAAIRTVQGSYSGSGSGSTTYYYMPIALYGNEAWITLTNRLSYGHTYYVNCDPGLFLDSNGASFTGISGTNSWVISTKSAGPATPTTSSGPASITIGQDGAGDFATFQGAFDWIPASNTLARTVHVLPGIYRDSATLAGNRNFVTIVGDGASRTNAQLIYPFVYFAPPNPVFTAGSLRIESSDVAVENLTLDNIIYGVYHPTGYASSGAPTNFAGAINTLATTGKRIVFDNVLVKGGQDTIYNISGIIYYTNCEVWGSVDFIYGAALGVFDQCNIVEIRSTGGPITAPNTLYAQPYGMTFLNCTFPRALVANGYPYDVNAGSTTFQRAWGQDGMTTIFNCAVDSQISTAGWGTFGSGGENTCRAREYGTTLIGGGSAPTITQRQAAGTYWLNTMDPDYTNNPSLSPTDPLLAPPTGTNNRVAVTVNPNDYTLSAIFGNSYFNLNGWLPAIVPIFTTQPTNRTVNSGATTTFVAAAAGHPDPSFQWLKNGARISNATNTTLTIANVQPGDAGAYSLVASNTAGSATSSAATLSVNFATNMIAGVSVPAINFNNVVNVLDYGAAGDGVSTNTTAIQNAINQAGRGGKTNNLYGGTVEIPPGIFLSGPLTLTNNVNLQIDAGAILRMLPFTNYPMTWFTNNTTNVYFVVADDFISGNNLTNIEISGSGAIDGQGSPWWPWAYTNNAVRPAMISLSGCNRELIQNVTLSNSPSVFIGIGSGSGNTIVQYVTVRAPSSYDSTNPSHNTDACDVRGTNILVQFNDISTGDDDFSCLGSTSGVIVSNNVYGEGHGTSMGSQLAGGASNFVFINCTYTNTDACAHIKSDRGRGGLIQNINYYNLTFTNVVHPIQIYCEYTNKTIPALDSITPAAAAALTPAPVTSTTPMYRDITISNFSGNAQSTRAAGLIWGLPESSISNVTLINVTLTGSKTFGIYDAKNVQIIDSTHTVPAGVRQYSFFDADVTFSNSTPSTSMVTLDGVTTNGIANSFRFYNSLMTLSNTNAIALNSSVTLGASTFTISNNLAVTPSNSFSFYLGTNAATVVVKGNLTLGGIVNAAAGSGFTNGTYTLITYTGSLNGNLPVLGTTLAGYVCSLNTNTAGQVNLVVAAPVVPSVPTGLTATAGNAQVALSWTASADATSYNVKRSTISGSGYVTIATPTGTNYTDTTAVNGTTYFYVISAANSNGESGNCSEVSATPTCSLAAVPTGVSATAGNAQVALSWTASAGATSYNVKRSTTSGSGYVTIATPTGTSYTDTTAINGTTYYYVISAANSCGESANSVEVSAKPQRKPHTAAQLSGQLVGSNDGDIVLTYPGTPGDSYALERTFSLTPPSVWLPQTTNSVAADGYVIFTNTPDPGTNNYWRIRYVP